MTDQQIAEFLAACHRAAEYGLLRCSSGNLSWRIDGEHAMVTATRSWLGDLTADQIALFRIADCTPVNSAKPSVEMRFHCGILRQRPDVNVVLHFQSPAATTLTCSRPERINFFVIPEIPYYIGPVSVVPYLNPGSAELAEGVITAMKHHNLALLTGHGQVTVGQDFHDALQKASFFELACDIILRGGGHVQPLSDDAVKQLMSQESHRKGV